MSQKAPIDAINRAVDRVAGLGKALHFMAKADLGDSHLNADSFRNAVEEVAGAIEEALSPAFQALFDLNACGHGGTK